MRGTETLPAAVVAFVRGIERRAWLFLWLQAGDEDRASQTLAAGIRAFSRQAAGWAMAEWPVRFWRLLAAAPVAGKGQWPAPLQALAGFAGGPRRALLLRLVAGLDEQPAAEALGLDLDGYRQALAAAVARDAGGEVDADAWHALAQAVHQAGRDLPARRLAAIAQLRETALWGSGSPAATVSPEAAPVAGPPRRIRQRWPWILAVMLACALALLATLWLRPATLGVGDAEPAGDGDALRVVDHGPVQVEDLPPDPAAGTIAPAPEVPGAPADPLVARFDLLSWYAAGAPASRIEQEAPAEAETSAPAGPPLSAGSGPADAARNLAWESLGPVEQARVRGAAAAFDALEAAEQERLRARFQSLDVLEQRGWQLGPELGQDWPQLQLLLGYVAPAQRQALLQSLRALHAPERQALAELGRRAGAEGRQALLEEWLRVPPGQRPGWLQARVPERLTDGMR